MNEFKRHFDTNKTAMCFGFSSYIYTIDTVVHCTHFLRLSNENVVKHAVCQINRIPKKISHSRERSEMIFHSVWYASVDNVSTSDVI